MSRVSGKPYFVYVLWSASGSRFYIGVSENPRRRLQQHNLSGRGWSARYCPWELVHMEKYDNYRAARKRERKLKAQKSGGGFFLLTGLDASRFPRPANTEGS